MTVAVDSNVLFDLLLDDPEHADASRTALLSAARSGPVVICPVVYAELTAHFAHAGDLDRFLGDAGVQMTGFEPESLVSAGDAWKRYRRRAKEQPRDRCPHCRRAIVPRRRVITDFLIGGHAMVQASRLLTRDRGYYRTYFPRLAVVDPETRTAD
ncbi:MAG TPA: type II toxin-antitoxin system VapC family toxin [bacterium]|nr:type II toxin-antitoxin system VapC family toxin [bacterium]